MDYRCHQDLDSLHVINLKVENNRYFALIDYIIANTTLFHVSLTDYSNIYCVRIEIISSLARDFISLRRNKGVNGAANFLFDVFWEF